MFKFVLSLNGETITESNYEYDSYEEAESEGRFAADTYADSMDVHWSRFETEIKSEYERER